MKNNIINQIRIALFTVSLLSFSTANAQWVQDGPDAIGAQTNALFGYSVSYSHDGTKVAVGSPMYDDGGNTNIGKVDLYQINGDGSRILT